MLWFRAVTTKGLLFTIVFMVAIMGIMTGCSSKGQGGSTNSASPNKVDTKKDPIDLYFFQTGDLKMTSADFMDKYGNYIKEKFPYITPQFLPVNPVGDHNMNDLIASGQQVDIMISSIGLTQTYLVDNNFQYDISGLIKSHNVDLTRFVDNTVKLQNLIAGGGMYGVPMSITSPVINYNKDIFDKFGVSYPHTGMTWDDYYALSKQLTRKENGVQYYGLLMSPEHLLKTNQSSIPMVDPKTAVPLFDNPKLSSYMSTMLRFYTLVPQDSMNAGLFFSTPLLNMFIKDRNLAMYAMFPVTIPSDLNADYAPFPVDQNGAGPQAYPSYAYITRTSKYKDAAMDVIQALTSDEFQMTLAQKGISGTALKNPAILKAYGQDLPSLKGKNVSALFPAKYADPAPITEYDAVALKPLLVEFQNIAAGKEDQVTGIRTAIEGAKQAIESKQAQSKK